MTTIPPRITAGIDTHLDVHVAAALDERGGLLGVESFPTTAAGYRRMLGWLGAFGQVELVGVEGTGSYGAGLTRHLHGDDDIVEPAIETEMIFRYSSLATDTAPVMRGLGDRAPKTFALMHGSSFNGDGAKALSDLANAYETQLLTPSR